MYRPLLLDSFWKGNKNQDFYQMGFNLQNMAIAIFGDSNTLSEKPQGGIIVPGLEEDFYKALGISKLEDIY